MERSSPKKPSRTTTRFDPRGMQRSGKRTSRCVSDADAGAIALYEALSRPSQSMRCPARSTTPNPSTASSSLSRAIVMSPPMGMETIVMGAGDVAAPNISRFSQNSARFGPLRLPRWSGPRFVVDLPGILGPTLARASPPRRAPASPVPTRASIWRDGRRGIARASPRDGWPTYPAEAPRPPEAVGARRGAGARRDSDPSRSHARVRRSSSRLGAPRPFAPSRPRSCVASPPPPCVRPGGSRVAGSDRVWTSLQTAQIICGHFFSSFSSRGGWMTCARVWPSRIASPAPMP